MTVAELHERMTAKEYLYWMARERVEPIPDLNALFARLFSQSHKHHYGKAIPPSEFYPVRRPRRKQSAEEALAIMQGVAATMAGNPSNV